MPNAIAFTVEGRTEILFAFPKGSTELLTPRESAQFCSKVLWQHWNVRDWPRTIRPIINHIEYAFVCSPIECDGKLEAILATPTEDTMKIKQLAKGWTIVNDQGEPRLVIIGFATIVPIFCDTRMKLVAMLETLGLCEAADGDVVALDEPLMALAA